MKYLFLFVAIVITSTCSRAWAQADPDEASGEERRELWTGSLYSSTYRAGICINERGDLRGAVYLRRMGGEVDRYTVFGKVSDDRIMLTHHSGHEFKGSFVPSDGVRGELTLKSGRKMEVKAVRSLYADVDEHCRLVQP